MKPESQRIAIAEACGNKWTLASDGWYDGPRGDEGLCYERMLDKLPNYPADRDTIIKAARQLTPDQQCKYIDELEQIIRRPENAAFGDPSEKRYKLNHFGRFAVATATALQHCEAYCRTLYPERFK